MVWLILAALVAALPARAEVRFEPVAVPEHVYSGGWEHFVGGGLAVWDCDGDGLPEMLAAGGAGGTHLFRNRSETGRIAFDAGVPAALDGVTGVTGAYPLDLDADGVRDLFVMRAGPNIALRGLPDCGFERMPMPDGGDAWSTAFTAWWEPGAARPTLAIGNYVDRADPEGPFGTCDANAILWPDGKGWREEELAPGFCALSMLAARDARGRPTLRISNDRHYYVKGGAEQMWDIGERRFLGAEDGWAGPALWGMGIASRDIDGDGAAEVMLTSMGDQLLTLARDGRYEDAPYAMGATATTPHTGGDGRPSTGWHAEWGDVENDGDDDLFIVKGNVDQMPGMAMDDPNNLLLRDGDGFREVAAEARVASLHRGRGGALADLDGDGRLDIAVVNRRAPLEVWRNVSDAGHSVSVELRQDGPNAFALGAVIEVRIGDRTMIREVTVGGGHAGGRAGPEHFGIGDADGVEVRVTWPDGTASGWTPLPAGFSGILQRDGTALRPVP